MSEIIASNILGIILSIIGIVVVIIGVSSSYKNRHRMTHWRLAEGVIIGPFEKFRNDAEDPAYPVIEFQDETGLAYSFQSDWTMSGLPGIGSKVQVLYDPQNPENAIYHTGYSTHFMPIMLILAGIAVIRVAVYYLLDI
jgi:uncharacterized membrane protein